MAHRVRNRLPAKHGAGTRVGGTGQARQAPHDVMESLGIAAHGVRDPTRRRDGPASGTCAGASHRLGLSREATSPDSGAGRGTRTRSPILGRHGLPAHREGYSLEVDQEIRREWRRFPSAPEKNGQPAYTPDPLETPNRSHEPLHISVIPLLRRQSRQRDPNFLTPGAGKTQNNTQGGGNSCSRPLAGFASVEVTCVFSAHSPKQSRPFRFQWAAS